MIEIKAPGKLFVAGEYAVVEPGHPSILVAVDRCVTVRLEASEHEGRIFSDQYGRAPIIWRRNRNGVVVDHEERPLDHVLSAVSTMEALVAELGVAPKFSALSITSELDDESGRKFGLGSSAAVTTATVRALDEFYQLDLTRTQMLKLAILATIDVAPAASGGDLAASMFGGWLRYTSPDRARLRELRHQSGVLAALRDPWAELGLERLSPPTSLRLLVGWTGEPASTTRLVDELQSRKWAESAHYTAFLTASRAAVDALTIGLNDDDPALVLGAVRSARATLAGLGRDAGVDIETAALAQLCDAAERLGGAAKSSGAGGGDCGIAFIGQSVSTTALEDDWSAHGIERLPLTVHPPTGLIDAAHSPWGPSEISRTDDAAVESIRSTYAQQFAEQHDAGRSGTEHHS